MRKTQPTFVHHLNQIAKAELVTQVPAYTKDDHIPVEMSPCKQVLHAFHLRPISSKSPMYPTHPLYLHQSPLFFFPVVVHRRDSGGVGRGSSSPHLGIEIWAPRIHCWAEVGPPASWLRRGTSFRKDPRESRSVPGELLLR